jgi:uncharacterized protein (TIGR02246 family)
MTRNDSATMTQDDRAARAVLDRLYDAWAVSDADGFVADYAENATSILPATYLTGRNAIRDRMAGVLAGPMKGSRVRDEVQSVRFLGDSAAVIVSRSAVVMPGEEPDAVPADRWLMATWTLTRQDDRWLVVAYHCCAAA